MSSVATHFKDSGEGRTYVLLHGFCLDHTIWDSVRAPLDKDLHTITPDLPGFGKSDSLPEVLTINALGKWLNNWTDSIGLEKFVLLGHSLGGYVALEFAKRFSHKLLGLGLIHSHCFGDTGEKKFERQKVERFVANHGSVPYLKESIPNLFYENFRIQKADVVAEVVEHNRFIDPDVIIHYLQAMRLRNNEEQVLQDLKVPSLFVMGADDQLVSLSQNLKQSIYPDISSIKIMDEVGHMGMIENPEQVANAILDFDELLENYQAGAEGAESSGSE